jgi:hypothetical protein
MKRYIVKLSGITQVPETSKIYEIIPGVMVADVINGDTSPILGEVLYEATMDEDGTVTVNTPLPEGMEMITGYAGWETL